MENNLLVVDWDYFFPNPLDGGEYIGNRDNLLYDWSKAEAPYYIDMAWDSRAIDFLRNGRELPRAENYAGFWDRFNFAEDTTAFIADSNRHAGHFMPDEEIPIGWESVWLYDAHHDAGYKVRSLEQFRESPTFDCEDWMLVHECFGSELHVRYPTWKVYAFEGETQPAIELDRQYDDGSMPPVTFNGVFVCRSGAWVPAWCDDQFEEFVNSFPGNQQLYDTTDPTPMLRRPFDKASIEQQMKMQSELIEKMRNQVD